MDNITNPTATDLILVVNGQTHTTKTGSTVTDLLEDFHIAPSRVVVQLDGVIVSRETFAQTLLREGSQLEVVTLVGGG